jgi:hypothetical protein
VEIMVAMAIFAIVMTSVAQIIRHTVRFYNTHVRAIEVQQQAIQAARWITQEMEEGSYQSVSSVFTPSPHVIFGSPRNLDGKLEVVDGRMLWQKFVCYYVGTIKGDQVLKRGELLFQKAAQAPPPIPTSITLSSFEKPGATERIIARHIESISVTLSDSAKIEIKANLDNGAFTLKLQTRVEMGN